MVAFRKMIPNLNVPSIGVTIVGCERVWDGDGVKAFNQFIAFGYMAHSPQAPYAFIFTDCDENDPDPML